MAHLVGGKGSELIALVDSEADGRRIVEQFKQWVDARGIGVGSTIGR